MQLLHVHGALLGARRRRQVAVGCLAAQPHRRRLLLVHVLLHRKQRGGVRLRNGQGGREGGWEGETDPAALNLAHEQAQNQGLENVN